MGIIYFIEVMIFFGSAANYGWGDYQLVMLLVFGVCNWILKKFSN